MLSPREGSISTRNPQPHPPINMGFPQKYLVNSHRCPLPIHRGRAVSCTPLEHGGGGSDGVVRRHPPGGFSGLETWFAAPCPDRQGFFRGSLTKV